MQRTKAQVQLQYHQTLNRICEIELLADQLRRLAYSYKKEEREQVRALRDAHAVYLLRDAAAGSGDALREQADELKRVAEDWYRQAREEYRTELQEARLAEERSSKW